VAWQLHYTSAQSGPTGRAGFQFVAATPGLPPGTQTAVAPYLAYRPPPRAMPSPGPRELARFPVALSYDRAGGHAVLVRCRYLGRDYSGRYGNFLAHAVVAESAELEGLRPIELWRSELWSDVPGHGDLPALDDVAPGDVFDPGALARWLAAEHAYDLFTEMADAVAEILERGHGRVVLVADDVDLIARWIAVVSYSLPVASAASLSFVTYTDDPEGAPYRIAGTTPDIWSSASHATPAFVLTPSSSDLAIDQRSASAKEKETGRYARTAADRWREHDLAGLDALGELAGLGSGFDTAAALLALCRGDSTVTPEEEASAAGLLRRHGSHVPAWVWRDLAPAPPRIGFELASAIAGLADRELAERCAVRCVVLALDDLDLRSRLPRRALGSQVRDELRARLEPIFADAVAAAPDLIEIAGVIALADRCGVRPTASEVAAAAARCARRGAGDLVAAVRAAPPELRDALVTGALAGVEAAAPASRSALLTDSACDLALGQDLTRTPRVGLRVMSSIGRRHRAKRVELTREAVALERYGLGSSEIDVALRAMWSGAAPTVAECMTLFDFWGPDTMTAILARYTALSGLPSRAFVGARAELDAPEVAALAERVTAARGTSALGKSARDKNARDKNARAENEDATAIGETVRADAALVTGYAQLMRSTEGSADVAVIAKGLNKLAVTQASPRLIDAVFTSVAERLAARGTEFREKLLSALTEPARARLAEHRPAAPERRGSERRGLFRRRGG
jgi:hypothetical protein